MDQDSPAPGVFRFARMAARTMALSLMPKRFAVQAIAMELFHQRAIAAGIPMARAYEILGARLQQVSQRRDMTWEDALRLAVRDVDTFGKVGHG